MEILLTHGFKTHDHLLLIFVFQDNWVEKTDETFEN
jgi:hypothetical protein